MSYTTPLYTLKEWQAAQATIAALQRENAALREALERIVGMCGDPPRDRCPCGRPTGVAAVQHAARRALTPSAAPCEHAARTEAPSIHAPSGRVVCRKCEAVLSAAPGEEDARG